MNSLIENSIEQDLNPFIIFDSNARVVKYNTEAEYLLSSITPKELYDFALNYAPQTYGFKNSYLDAELGRGHYYAIMVGYKDDNYLLLKLYKSVDTASATSEKKEQLASTNIYALIEVALNNTLKNTKVKKYLDPSLPEIQLNAKTFLSLLNSSLDIFKESQDFTFTLKIKVAENIVVNNKRYPVCLISLQSNQVKNQDITKLNSLAKEANAVIFFENNKLSIEFALIV
jgi:nitrogen-specific signal transduction histidine kinase